MKVQKLNEALDFGDAAMPGRGACCPTAVDMMNLIDDALNHIDDPKYTKPATNQLKWCAKSIIDNKQSFENFNAYWEERFPSMIDYLDSQLSKIPSSIIATISSMDEGLSDRIRKGTLDHNDAMDTFGAEEDDVQIELQDRERHTHEFGTTTNQWGRSFVGDQLNKQPRVATQTWGRVWKDGKFDKSFEGPKYQVRAEMAKYLDSKAKQA